MKRVLPRLAILTLFAVSFAGCEEKQIPSAYFLEDSKSSNGEIDTTTGELKSPVKLQADGRSIDTGILSGIGHAGPLVADIDCDGDRDLLVGDFPGYFWYFENDGTDEEPDYISKGKLQAGGEDAKTPVY